MLKFFTGKPVELISCGAVYNTTTDKMFSAVDKCTITFRHNLNLEEITRYVDKYPVTKFAGAFDLEGAMLLGEKYEGNVTITLGFPFDKVIEFIRENGVEC